MLLFLVVLLGFIIRLAGANFGLPDLIHTDEARIILDSLSMGQRISLLSEDVNYPLFTKYMFTISYGLYFVVGLLSGFFKDKVDFAAQFLANPANVVYLSRVVMTIAGSMTIIVAYFWGKLIDKSKRTGLIAALFVAVEWQLVLESQYALHQTLAALGSLLAFLGISLLCVSKNIKSYVFGGMMMGVAISSHQTAILLVPAIAFLFASDFLDKKIRKSILMKNWLTFSLMAAVIGVLGNLNFIFQFQRSLNFFLQGSGAARVAFSSTPYFSYDLISIFGWYLYEFIRRNYVIGLLSAFSILISLKQRKRLDVIYLITIATYLVFFRSWAFRWMHLFVSLIPISIVFSARTLSRLIEKMRFSGMAASVICIVLIVPNLHDLIKMDLAKQIPETRQQALEWIKTNIPPGARLAVDYPAHAVPIPSAYPNMLRNRVAMAYFDKSVSQEIKDRYFEIINKNSVYEVIDLIDSKDAPVWPSDMPSEAIDRASASATMRDIYAYFNFKPLSEIKSSGVEYIVVTSYTYGMFLVSSDPRKEPLANSYIKDNVLPFLNHDGEISMGTQHELVYYVSARGRDYYSQLLDNKIAGVKLVMEFIPDKGQFGPTVKVYLVE